MVIKSIEDPKLIGYLKSANHAIEAAMEDADEDSRFLAGMVEVEQPLRVDQVMQQAIATNKLLLDEQTIELETQIDGHFPSIMGKPLLLENAFGNLVINADQAIETRERIEGNHQEKKITIYMSTDIEANAIHIAIKDTGTGIPEENIDKIGIIGWTSKTANKITSGLGVPNIIQAIERHGGAVFVESITRRMINDDPEKYADMQPGTTFHIVLPITREAGQLDSRGL